MKRSKVILLLMLIMAAVVGCEESPEESFNKGVSAFNGGNYATAGWNLKGC